MKSSSESVVIGHFRNIKERLFGAKRPRNDVVTNEEGVSGFETLPVMKLLVLQTFFPTDIVYYCSFIWH